MQSIESLYDLTLQLHGVGLWFNTLFIYVFYTRIQSNITEKCDPLLPYHNYLYFRSIMLLNPSIHPSIYEHDDTSEKQN